MTQTIDMLQFCDQYAERMMTPFVIGGKLYATDARIAVEVDATGEPDTPTTGNNRTDPPNVQKVFETTWDGTEVFKPWPAEAPIIGEIDCPQCENIVCKDCDGEGILECDMGHDHDCETCDGYGEIRNRKCVCKGT